jgi:hypothetical protein
MPLYLYHDPVMRCSSLASDLDFACGMGIHYFMQKYIVGKYGVWYRSKDRCEVTVSCRDIQHYKCILSTSGKHKCTSEDEIDERICKFAKSCDG